MLPMVWLMVNSRWETVERKTPYEVAFRSANNFTACFYGLFGFALPQHFSIYFSLSAG